MTAELAGKVAIITGGCRGIGKEIASRFVEEGASVVTCCRHEHPRRATHGKDPILRLQCDVRNIDQINEVIAITKKRFRHIDILVNNAGGAPPAETSSASPRFFEAVIAINLTAVLVFSQRANVVMQHQAAGGCIINLGSVAGLEPAPSMAAYGAAKAGVINLTRTLAHEWGPKVRVNCVAPGLVMTEEGATWVSTKQSTRRAAASIPLRRLGTPRDVADVCLFLASQRAIYVNGETIVVDGGSRMPHGLVSPVRRPRPRQRP